MNTEIKTNHIAKLLRSINLGLVLSVAVCVYFDRAMEGIGYCLTLMGLVLIFGGILNTASLVFTMGGFYHLIKNPLHKQYYARFINWTWGLLILGIGIAALVKIHS
jgi:hypothetical protein